MRFTERLVKSIKYIHKRMKGHINNKSRNDCKLWRSFKSLKNMQIVWASYNWKYDIIKVTFPLIFISNRVTAAQKKLSKNQRKFCTHTFLLWKFNWTAVRPPKKKTHKLSPIEWQDYLWKITTRFQNCSIFFRSDFYFNC